MLQPDLWISLSTERVIQAVQVAQVGYFCVYQCVFFCKLADQGRKKSKSQPKSACVT